MATKNTEAEDLEKLTPAERKMLDEGFAEMSAYLQKHLPDVVKWFGADENKALYNHRFLNSTCDNKDTACQVMHFAGVVSDRSFENIIICLERRAVGTQPGKTETKYRLWAGSWHATTRRDGSNDGSSTTQVDTYIAQRHRFEGARRQANEFDTWAYRDRSSVWLMEKTPAQVREMFGMALSVVELNRKLGGVKRKTPQAEEKPATRER
jgi:hypothetical protein